MTTPTSELDRLDQAPEAQRGDFVRFAKVDLRADRVAMEPGFQDPAARRVVPFDPATHSPNDAIDALHTTTTPVNPRHQLIERRMFIPSPEFDLLRESLHALGKHLRDLDGAYAQVRWKADRRLGKYTDRQGNERERTAMVVDRLFADVRECQAAADAFYAERRGGGPAGEGATPPPPAPAGATTTDGASADAVERQTLLAFLPALARGKTRAQFFEALAADARFGRHFGPGDPDVLAVLDQLGIPASASGA